jgi:hypothetical protein
MQVRTTTKEMNMKFPEAMNALIDLKPEGILFRRSSQKTYLLNSDGRLNTIKVTGEYADPDLTHEDLVANDWAIGVTID